MYAIIKTGGKQYRVEQGDILDVELLGEEDGATVKFDDVLFVNNGEGTLIGAPSVEGYVVLGEVVEMVKGPKVFAFKYKRRKNYHRKVGHRQRYSRVKIKEIQCVR